MSKGRGSVESLSGVIRGAFKAFGLVAPAVKAEKQAEQCNYMN